MTKTTTKNIITKIINRFDDPYVYVEFYNVDSKLNFSIQKYDANEYEIIFVKNGKYIQSNVLNENSLNIVTLFNDNPEIKSIIDNTKSNDRI